MLRGRRKALRKLPSERLGAGQRKRTHAGHISRSRMRRISRTRMYVTTYEIHLEDTYVTTYEVHLEDTHANSMGHK